MSFYGNISNAGKTQIGFDKIYPNKKTMDSSVKTDGVFVGRYVLIEYDDNTFSYRRGYLKFKPDIEKEKNNQIIHYLVYSDETCQVPYALSQNNVNTGYGIKKGDIVYAVYGQVVYFFESDGSTDYSGNARFRLIYCKSKEENIDYENGNFSDYTLNYSIDNGDSLIFEKEFPSTGWDSTIWQKVADGGQVVYKKIADLNSVTPTFQIEPEAPTLNPIAPHFGSNSTNINYTLHVQPNWGLKVKKAVEPEDPNKEMLSDFEVVYTTQKFNEETQLDETVSESYPASIYFNQAGFNKENISHSDELNEISILPTGISGNLYAKHTNSRFNIIEMEERPDIQEITMHLPEIGNTIASVWDILYGNEKINGGKTRNLDIYWDSTLGLRLVTMDPDGTGFSYDPERMESVAGCINSVHDLMGMIISTAPESNQTLDQALEAAQSGRIYFGPLSTTSAKKSYYFKDKDYKFYTFDEYKEIDPTFTSPENYVGTGTYFDLTQFEPNKYYVYSDRNFYLEKAELPTEDTFYYLLGTPVEIKLKQWQPTIQQTNPETGKLEKVTDYSYFITDTNDYIKDIRSKPDDSITNYCKITATAVTKPNDALPVYIWSPENYEVLANKESNPELFKELSFEIDSVLIDNNNIIEFRAGYMKMVTDADGENTALIEVTSSINNIYDANSKYYYIPKYAVSKGQQSQGGDAYTLWFISEDSNADGKKELISFSNAVIDESDALNLYKQHEVKFLPFNENTTYYAYKNDFSIEEKVNDEIKKWTTDGYKCIHAQEEIDKQTVYYTIEAKPEIGDLTVDGEVPDENTSEDSIFPTYYYQPHKYFYKSDDNYILSAYTNINDGYTYYLLTDKNNILLEESSNAPGLYDIEPEDVEFYYPGKYYYRSSEERFDEDILDNSITMKVATLGADGKYHVYDEDGNDVVNPEYIKKEASDPRPMVYYIPNEVYVIEDTEGVLSKGQVWNLGNKVPDTVTLGVRVDGFKWTELKGFARTLNTIHGLILQINKFLKFGDETTRDTNTVQGCINKINDILNAMDSYKPGDVIVIDDYGRHSASKVIGDNWVTPTTTSTLNQTSINVEHNEAQTIKTTKGQSSNASPKFGDTFKTLQTAIDEKGHVNTMTERTITLPILQVTDTDTKQIVTDVAMSADNQKLELTRENVGSFALTGYTAKSTTSAIVSTDTVNDAFGKLQKAIDDEVANRGNEITAVNNRIDAILDGVTEEELNTFKELSDALNDDENFAATVNNSIAKVADNLNAEISNREAAITEVNTNLNDTAAAIRNELSQETTRALQAESDLSAEIAKAVTKDTEFSWGIVAEGSVPDETVTIQQLTDRVYALENLVQTLSSQVEELSALITPPDENGTES